MSRPDWDEYFFKMAETVSTRASCWRAKVGCIIVNSDRRIISTGFNGAAAKMDDCLKLGSCYRNDNNIASGTQLERCRAAGAHAELNAIVQAARVGLSVKGANLYLVNYNTGPCVWCRAILLNAGIKRVLVKNDSGEVKTFYPANDFLVHPFLPSY